VDNHLLLSLLLPCPTLTLQEKETSAIDMLLPSFRKNTQSATSLRLYAWERHFSVHLFCRRKSVLPAIGSETGAGPSHLTLHRKLRVSIERSGKLLKDAATLCLPAVVQWRNYLGPDFSTIPLRFCARSGLHHISQLPPHCIWNQMGTENTSVFTVVRLSSRSEDERTTFHTLYSSASDKDKGRM